MSFPRQAAHEVLGLRPGPHTAVHMPLRFCDGRPHVRGMSTEAARGWWVDAGGVLCRLIRRWNCRKTRGWLGRLSIWVEGESSAVSVPFHFFFEVFCFDASTAQSQCGTLGLAHMWPHPHCTQQPLQMFTLLPSFLNCPLISLDCEDHACVIHLVACAAQLCTQSARLHAHVLSCQCYPSLSHRDTLRVHPDRTVLPKRSRSPRLHHRPSSSAMGCRRQHTRSLPRC